MIKKLYLIKNYNGDKNYNCNENIMKAQILIIIRGDCAIVNNATFSSRK